MKIAINKCFGGFGVSKEIYRELDMEWTWNGHGYLNNKSFGIDSDDYYEYRYHPDLIAAIEKIGEEKSSGEFANIKIVEIPDNVEWEIKDFDGNETIHEQHRIW